MELEIGGPIAEYVGELLNPDRDSEYGPPDKAQHFCEDDDFSPLPKTKPVHKQSRNGKERVTKSSPKPKNPDVRKNVEVLYDDGKWYWGWLDSFNFQIGKWIVKFYDDSENAEVLFPDRDVGLCD